MKSIVLASCVLVLVHPVIAQEMTFHHQAENDKVILYEHANFSGQSKTLGVGTYQFSAADFNDKASSIKVPAGLIAVLYDAVHDKGGYGRYVDLLEDCTDLSVYNFNDKLTYMTIFSATRPGYIFVRNRVTDNKSIPGHWERARANGQNPDNSPPAIVFKITDRKNEVDISGNEPILSTGDEPIQRIFEDMPVYRIQLKLTTGTTQDAGTDNPVFAQLNTMDEKFYLVKGIDNFQEGKTVVYDLLSLKIKKVKDIEFIKFGIKGSDGVCIKRVELLLNGNSSPVYSRTFDGVKGVCFDNASSALQPTLEIAGNMLRGSSAWNDAGAKKTMWAAPGMISIAWLKSSIEGSIGNQLYHRGDLRWSSYATGPGSLYQDAVKIQRVDDHTVKFNVHLERDVLGPNPLIDMSFNLDFHCTDGKLSCDIENFNTESNWLGDVRDFIIEKGSLLAAGAITVFTGGLGFPSFFGAVLLNINNGFITPSQNGGAVTAACLKAQVNANGDIIIK